MSVPRGLLASYYDAPDRRTIDDDRPTLLVTWWCTGCCIALIGMRLLGRYIRVAKLFRDDKFMALSILPLLGHQALVHMVLLYGTNNTTGTEAMGKEELRRRRIGSGMVLGARVMYAAFLWSQKFCITEFYVRLTEHFWEKGYELGLRIMRWSLLVTFLAATISVFGECRPGHKLWQVHPSPGPQCRSGFAPLITISTFSIVTDLFLVLYPIPMIIRSSFTTLKKLRLILTVFSLSLLCVAFASYRVPAVIRTHGSQQLRSLLAAFEILVSTIVSNAIIINSFARGKGEKKRKFSGASGVDDAEAGQVRMAYWGSDDDIARYLGVGRVPGVAPVQKGYGFTRRSEEAPRSDERLQPRAVLHGAAVSAEMEEQQQAKVDSCELMDFGKDTTTITPPPPPPSPDDGKEHPVLCDAGGLLTLARVDENESTTEYSDDDDYDLRPRTSVSSSSVGLKDTIAERDREVRR
ncbi:hypothetical protein BZA05DRAFT_414699 [Tricharina praecox]|uniref:uncharacterized protein n=1 Tax=Tricharina praecox TaxID=43433 RepID=UPI00221F7B5A|nr:uncharacterized protein BZA05DRAFT_414699 [Tricharina praecox]KAI5858948.1 hypothetical protein BZA05DRAFT_414699 [Tricharina praecox]